MLRVSTTWRGLLSVGIVFLAVFNQNVAADDILCELIVGYDPSIPYYAPDSMGKVVGIDANILRDTAAQVGCRLDFVELPWKRTLNMIESGVVDVTMSASFKFDRAEFAHYSVTYRGQPHLIYVKKESGVKAANIEDFLEKGHVLGIVSGWHYTNRIQTLVNDPKYSAQISEVPGLENAISMLDFDRFDGFLANPAQVLSVVGEEKFKTGYHLIEADKDYLHFIFSKKTVTADFVERFNTILDQRLHDGYFHTVCSEFEDQLITRCSDLYVGAPRL